MRAIAAPIGPSTELTPKSSTSRDLADGNDRRAAVIPPALNRVMPLPPEPSRIISFLLRVFKAPRQRCLSVMPGWKDQGLCRSNWAQKEPSEHPLPNLAITRFMSSSLSFEAMLVPMQVMRHTVSPAFNADQVNPKSKVAIDIVCNDKTELGYLTWRKLTGRYAATENSWDEIVQSDANNRPFALFAHRERRLI